MDSATQYIMFATVLYYIRKQNIPHARAQIQNIFEQYPLTEVTKLVFHGLDTTLAFDDRDIEDMLFHATSYLSLWDWKNAHAAAAANELAQYVTAHTFWERLPLDKPGFDAKPYETDLNVTLLGLKRIQLLHKKREELLQQIELLEQAEQQAQTLSASGQINLANEYIAAKQQFLVIVKNTCNTLLGEHSQTMQLLNSESFSITELKQWFIQDSERLLYQNPLT